MRIFSTFLVVFLAATAALATGDGFVVGSGGDAILCRGSFSNCPQNASNGCRSLSFNSPVTQEFFVASMTADQNQSAYLKSWRDLTDDQTIQRLYSKISTTELYAKLIEVRQNLGRVDMGLSLPGMTSLQDVQDSILPIALPAACEQKQAVIRVDNLFYYNSRLIEMMRGSSAARQLALLNFHEYLYYYGKTFRGHVNSLNAQSLIVFLLTRDATAAQLDVQLRQLSFID